MVANESATIGMAKNKDSRKKSENANALAAGNNTGMAINVDGIPLPKAVEVEVPCGSEALYTGHSIIYSLSEESEKMGESITRTTLVFNSPSETAAHGNNFCATAEEVTKKTLANHLGNDNTSIVPHWEIA